MTTSSLETEPINPLSSENFEEQFLHTELKKTLPTKNDLASLEDNLNYDSSDFEYSPIEDDAYKDALQELLEAAEESTNVGNTSAVNHILEVNRGISSEDLVQISLNQAEKLKAYEIARSYDINYLQKLFQDNQYSFYWYSLIKFLSLRPGSLKAEDLALIKKNFSDMNWDHLDNVGKTPEFLNGLAYFLQHQTIFTEEEILKTINKISGYCFAYSLRLADDATISIFAKYRNQISLSDYPGTIQYTLEKLDLLLFKKLVNSCTNVSFNHSKVLRDAWSAGFFLSHPEAFDFLIEKGCNVNDLENVAAHSSWNIVHAMIVATSHVTNLRFDSFIKKYGQLINYDTLYTIYDTNKNLLFKDNVINTLATSKYGNTIISELSSLDKMERFHSILKYSILSEKHISQISQFIFQPYIIVSFYDHPIYETFFKNPKFNSDLYDRKETLIQLINLDHDSIIKSLKQQNNHTVNPILILLDCFYKNSSLKNLNFSRHPFISWGQKYNTLGSLSYDSTGKNIANRNELAADYFIEKFKHDISKFSANQLLSLPSSLLSIMKQKGIAIPTVEKKNFFQKIFNFKDNVQFTPGEISETPSTVITEKNISDSIPFAQELFSQIQDKDITSYLSAIELNAEQFSLLINPDVVTNNSRYIQTVLPKLLNKTIENYLHFATMDLEEAKENVLIQLKLLNKKTFEVLKEGLDEEKENSARNGRVVTRIIKQS